MQPIHLIVKFETTEKSLKKVHKKMRYKKKKKKKYIEAEPKTIWKQCSLCSHVSQVITVIRDNPNRWVRGRAVNQRGIILLIGVI